jgi:hypothetical protein
VQVETPRKWVDLDLVRAPEDGGARSNVEHGTRGERRLMLRSLAFINLLDHGRRSAVPFVPVPTSFGAYCFLGQ